MTITSRFGTRRRSKTDPESGKGDPFIDMVDENVAREHGMQHNNPENTPAVTKAVSQTSFSPPRSTSPQVLEQIQSLKQPSPSRRTFLQQLPPSGCSPARGELNKKMTNAEEGGEPSRSALTPRTDKLSNGVKSPPSGTNGSAMMKEAAMPPRAYPRTALTPPRSEANAIRSSRTQPPEALDRNRIPKNPRDGASPKQRRPTTGPSSTASMKSQKSGRSIPSSPPQAAEVYDPDSQEQALFEQRLCEDAYGVAVRKINSNGKAQLRYVKCVPWDSADDDVSKGSATRSVTSLKRTFSRNSRKRGLLLNASAPTRALAWGRNNKIPLEKFVAVRKGKLTDRTRKNPQPSSRLLSLVTDTQTLDIEAPTRLDRDKFARAFARFLQVPLESDDAATTGNTPSPQNNAKSFFSSASSAPTNTEQGSPKMAQVSKGFLSVDGEKEVIEHPGASLGILAAQNAALFEAAAEDDDFNRSLNNSSSAPSKVFAPKDFIEGGDIVSGFSPQALNKDKEGGGSAVSSLTGGNYDQDIVEELHQALESLKVELEESRAEAARAVKVAEQAIQSAENNSSKDWNSTVTHKAAEAAALAQKRSAEAMAKQRLAEERLGGERKNAAFWRTQAEVAEEEAGVLQTRAAAAEVQRAAMMEELESERQKTTQLIGTLKSRFASTEIHSRGALDSEISRSRTLEIELHSARRTLDSKAEETKQLHEELHHVNSSGSDEPRQGSLRKKFNVLGKKKKTGSPESAKLLSSESSPSEALQIREPVLSSMESLPAEDVLKLHAEFTAIRLQFELLKRTTSDELSSLPETSQFLANQAGEALVASKMEMNRLRQRLALESSTRRKLLHEVQDLRGNVRVCCRPRPFSQPGTANLNGSLSMPSNEIVLLHRERSPSVAETTPLTFEFDHIFSPDVGQKEIYDELDELVLNALDGYNVCLMTYGASLTGKTHFMLGDVNYSKDDIGVVEMDNFGVHLQGAHQLFNVSKHRNQRYEDSFSLSVVEVNDERLCDLVAGTDVGEARGSVDIDVPVSVRERKARSVGEDEAVSQMSSKSRKLEIRTNNDGDTVVEGLVTVDVSSIHDVEEVWKQALSQRALRLRDQGVDLDTHESSSHMIATLKITSKSIATGVGTQGKIQFVDFAAADLRIQRTSSKSKNNKAPDDVLAPVGNTNDWKFSNKSLATLNDVVSKRAQFVREVPYRNSTVTHLLQDALEGDTKVLMMLCVSSDPKDMQETASALRFGAKMKQVNIGKATKHALHR